ncbi:MAG TPA: hypothetical protein DD415_00055 [Clostridiales bacterium]|nr:hypothetical protein [Clostridiales bacterium]
MPHVYGWQHILYLVIYFAAFAGGLTAVLMKVKRESTLELIFKISGGVLLALIIANRIAIAFHRETAWGLIPDSYCGLGNLCLAIALLVCKRDALPFHCLAYISFWGGAIATFYPDFLGQASYFMYPATITGLLHHGLALFLSVLLIATGYMKPSLKKFYAFPTGLSFIMCYGMFLIDAFGFESAMYIGKPLIEGSFLTWYVMAVLLIGATLFLVWLYEYLIKKRSEKVQQKTAGEA